VSRLIVQIGAFPSWYARVAGESGDAYCYAQTLYETRGRRYYRVQWNCIGNERYGSSGVLCCRRRPNTKRNARKCGYQRRLLHEICSRWCGRNRKRFIFAVRMPRRWNQPARQIESGADGSYATMNSDSGAYAFASAYPAGMRRPAFNTCPSRAHMRMLPTSQRCYARTRAP